MKEIRLAVTFGQAYEDEKSFPSNILGQIWDWFEAEEGRQPDWDEQIPEKYLDWINGNKTIKALRYSFSF